MTKKNTTCLIGTSGWVYKHWKERFYPTDLAQTKYLDFYAHEFPTAEVNNSFYRLPSVETYEKWAKAVDHDFVFAVKASRYLTHMKKLKDPEDPWQRVVSHASGLGEHLGPILLQFPARWGKNMERLEAFLELAYSGDTKYQLAFEFREPGWFEKDVLNLLEKYGAALCIADSTTFVRKEALTADFVYLRYHGRGTLYAGNYTARELQAEAKKIQKYLDDGIAVYAYFNNDGNANAIRNAKSLREMLAA